MSQKLSNDQFGSNLTKYDVCTMQNSSEAVLKAIAYFENTRLPRTKQHISKVVKWTKNNAQK